MNATQRKYVLKHKKNRVYLKLCSDGYKHYVVDVSEASKFGLRRAKEILKRFRHPENWEIINRGSESQKDTKRYKCIKRVSKGC